MEENLNLICCATIIFALFVLYLAVISYLNARNLIKTGRKTKAKVIDIIEVYHSSGDDDFEEYSYTPIFQFTDNENNEITFESESVSFSTKYRIGDTVDILYSNEYEQRKIVSFW